MVSVQAPARQQTLFARAAQWIQALFSRDGVVLATIIVVAFCFYLYRLGDTVIWYDESFTAAYAIQPLNVLWAGYSSGEMNMILYYLIMHAYVHFLGLFGITATEVVLRLPSVFLTSLSAGLLFLLGRRFVSRTAGIAAAILFLFNRYPLYAAHQARTYGLLLLILCASWYVFLTLLSGKSDRRWWLAYGVLATLSIYAHIIGLLFLFTQCVVVVLLSVLPTRAQGRARSLLLPIVGIAALVCASVVPLMWVAFHHLTKTLWLHPPELRDIPHVYVLYLTSAAPGLLRIAVFALLLAGAGFWVVARMSWGQRFIRPSTSAMSASPVFAWPESAPLMLAFACWLLLPPLVGFTVSRFTTQQLFTDRYMMGAVPALSLLLGMGLASIPWPRPRIAVLLGLALCFVLTTPSFFDVYHFPGFRAPAKWMIQRFHTGDGVVCAFKGQYEPACDNFEFEYYLYYYHAGALADYVATSAAPRSPDGGSPDNGSWDALAAYAARHPRLFYVSGDLGSTGDLAEQQSIQHWLDSHYHLIATIADGHNSIRLYDTTTAGLASRRPALPVAYAVSVPTASASSAVAAPGGVSPA